MDKGLNKGVKVGEEFSGIVKRIMDFGAFVEIAPGVDGLVHISRLADFRVERVEDVVKIGDVVPVKIIEIDEQGRINLSAKDAGFDPAPSIGRPAGQTSSHSTRPDHIGRSERRPRFERDSRSKRSRRSY